MEAEPIRWLVSNPCVRCGSEVSHGWSCTGGVFYCDRYRGVQLYGQRRRCQLFDVIVTPAFQQLHVLKTVEIERHDSGGPAERGYDDVDADPFGRWYLRIGVWVAKKDSFEVPKQ